MFGLQPKACCTPSSLCGAYVSNFVALRFMVAKLGKIPVNHW